MDESIIEERLKADQETMIYLLSETCDLEKDYHWVDSASKVIKETVQDFNNVAEHQIKARECDLEERKIALDEKFRPLEFEMEGRKIEPELSRLDLEERRLALDEKFRPLEYELELKKAELEKARMDHEAKVSRESNLVILFRTFAVLAVGFADIAVRVDLTKMISKREVDQPLLTNSDRAIANSAMKGDSFISKLFKL